MRSFATRISFCHTCALLPQACSFAPHACSSATDAFYLTHSRFSATIAFYLQHTLLFWPMLATPLHFSPIQDFPIIPCHATRHFSTLHLHSSFCPTTSMIHHCRHSVDGSKFIPFLDLIQVPTSRWWNIGFFVSHSFCRVQAREGMFGASIAEGVVRDFKVIGL